ncbi:hypothetical protein KUH03_40295 [Sphingobacterium sp. E70]|uniref:hypothetical protein n=1 Tax=Sphingobacterium sp. E70 TaxID=2853439 RepID=UPI00211C45AD|nr:hypothetical protein [Sphingobacterium sp. E70]ULT25037.1 hypothetical protein KUH03_40295 [Sphingobacterium sp. E70]
MFFIRQASAQQPTYYLNFDDFNFKKDIPLRDSACYNVDLLQSHYAKGLSGQALDLSAKASLRRPVRLAENTIPGLMKRHPFLYRSGQGHCRMPNWALPSWEIKSQTICRLWDGSFIPRKMAPGHCC